MPRKIFPKKVGKMGKRGNSPKIIFSAKNRYKEMPPKYSKGRKTGKTLKRGKSNTKRLVSKAKTKSLVKLIKKVSLKQAETKQTHLIYENLQLNHNSEYVAGQMLYTQQGITDNDAGVSNYVGRIGDEIILKGLSMKFWIANKLDRPNVMYRLVIYKYYNPAVALPNTVYQSQGSANVMLRDINTEKFTVLYVKTFNNQVGYSASTIGTQLVPSPNNVGREAHKLIKVYIPLKNRKLVYNGDTSGVPRAYDIAFSLCAYDSYGTLTTDNIASFSYRYKLYYKDP